MNGAWMSKVPTSGKDIAHFVGENGPACASLMCADGRPRLAPFKCGWTAMRPESHVCRDCRRLVGSSPECRCGLCTPGIRIIVSEAMPRDVVAIVSGNDVAFAKVTL